MGAFLINYTIRLYYKRDLGMKINKKIFTEITTIILIH